MLRFDFVDLSGARISQDGFIHDRPVLTRPGVFTYHNADGTTRREYRPPEEVFHADHLASLRGAPITDGHKGIARADDTHIIGTALTEGQREDDNLVGDVVIHHPGRMGAKRELSLGYRLDLDSTPGVAPDGQRYDAIQRNLRVNHLAVVHRGRAGNARLRLDGDDAATLPVEQEDSDLTDIKLVSVRLDGQHDYQVTPEAAAAISRQADALKAVQTRADTLEAERDTLKATTAGHAAALKQAREDGFALARARLALEAEAGEHGVEVRADMADRAVREAVVGKLQPNTFAFDGKSDDYVAATFDFAVAKVAGIKTRADEARRQVNGTGGGNPNVPVKTGTPILSAAAARERMLRQTAR